MQRRRERDGEEEMVNQQNHKAQSWGSPLEYPILHCIWPFSHWMGID